jgi:hypothetical protein
MFSRLIYVSRLSESVDAQETRRILAASQANNPRRAVTGALKARGPKSAAFSRASPVTTGMRTWN